MSSVPLVLKGGRYERSAPDEDEIVGFARGRERVRNIILPAEAFLVDADQNAPMMLQNPRPDASTRKARCLRSGGKPSNVTSRSRVQCIPMVSPSASVHTSGIARANSSSTPPNTNEVQLVERDRAAHGVEHDQERAIGDQHHAQSSADATARCSVTATGASQ